MRNLTGVLEATVLDPSGKGPRRLTDRRPQHAREDSASTGNPLLITSTRHHGRGQNADAASHHHHPAPMRTEPADTQMGRSQADFHAVSASPHGALGTDRKNASKPSSSVADATFR